MIYLSEESASQENMEAWLSQLKEPEFCLVKGTLLRFLEPQFISCSFAERTAEFAFAVKDWQLNPAKGLHGGILVTGFDISFGLLSHYFAKQHVVSTISINTTFLKPVQPTDVVHYKVRMTHMGHTVYQLTAEAFLERENILAATASATFMKLNQTYPYLV